MYNPAMENIVTIKESIAYNGFLANTKYTALEIAKKAMMKNIISSIYFTVFFCLSDCLSVISIFAFIFSTSLSLP
jgi:hypothetical protein